MSTVHSSGARAPFATPVSKSEAKAVKQPDRKIAVPRGMPMRPAAAVATAAQAGTEVSFGRQALNALEATGEFVGRAMLTGVEDLGDAACYGVRTAGAGLVGAARGVVAGAEDAAVAIGHGAVHVENALADVWGMATTGASDATTLATTLGADAQALVTNLGAAATDVGLGAKAVLSGVGSIASTAAGYGTYVVKQSGKALSELT